MRTLVIDCATQALSIALLDKDAASGIGCTDHRYQVMGRGHAEMLVPLVQEMLAGRRADAVAVDVGPGSFTGIRVGIAAARALGLAWGVPVTGYGCLSLCAAMVREEEQEEASSPGTPVSASIAIVMTGGHGELFWQRFDRASLAPLMPLTSTPIAQLARDLGDARLHGSGAATLVEARGWGDAVDVLPDSRFYPLLPSAHRGLPPVAVYGREADARPMTVPGTAA